MILLEVFLLPLLIVLAILAVAFRDLLSSVITLSVFSTVLAIVYLVHQAPDVALAEVVIGSGLMTAVYIAVISQIRAYRQVNKRGKKE